jgi:tetratricopeptide (TPR) repeat protein
VSKVAEEAEALLGKNDLKGAIAALKLGLSKDPDDMAALMMYAACVSREENWGLAYNLLKRVKEKSPAFIEIYNNLGMCAASLASSSGKEKYLEEAETFLKKAHRKKPLAETCANLALLMIQTNRPDEAIRYGEEALATDDGNVGARESIGYAYLHKGDWHRGFGNYEFNIGGKYRPMPKGTYWEAGDRGKNLLVIGEQGLGDEITYASVIPDAAKGNKITYECDKRLEGLMRRSLPGVKVVGSRFLDKKESGEDYDAACLSGSLCMEYRQKDEDFPRGAWLVPDSERRLQWRALLDTLPWKKVGISWTGGRENTFRTRRSFNLEALLPILKTPGVTWVSLQYDDPTDEIASLKEKHGIEIKHWPRAAGKNLDYDETAALVSELDCVVSITTAIVHLCGGLGKKCYVLVPKRCRWFYTSTSEKHRWYDSLELFRQEDKWPVERLAEKLKADLCK